MSLPFRSQPGSRASAGHSTCPTATCTGLQGGPRTPPGRKPGTGPHGQALSPPPLPAVARFLGRQVSLGPRPHSSSLEVGSLASPPHLFSCPAGWTGTWETQRAYGLESCEARSQQPSWEHESPLGCGGSTVLRLTWDTHYTDTGTPTTPRSAGAKSLESKSSQSELALILA